VGIGLAAGVAGAVALFVTNQSTGGELLIAVGLVLVVCGVTGQGLRSVDLLRGVVKLDFLADLEPELKEAPPMADGGHDEAATDGTDRNEDATRAALGFRARAMVHLSWAALHLGGSPYVLPLPNAFDAIVGVREWRIGVHVIADGGFSPTDVADHLEAACRSAAEAGHSVWAVMVIADGETPDPPRFGSLNAAMVDRELGHNLALIQPDTSPQGTILSVLSYIVDYLDKRRRVEAESDGKVPALAPLPRHG